MSELPFKKEDGWDYILTESDRKKFAPLQVTDECWVANGWMKTSNVPDLGFTVKFYRRRKSSGWVSVTPESLPNVMTDDGQMYRQVWACRHNVQLARVVYAGDLKENREDWQFWAPLDVKEKPQPPRPAAEVAFEEWYYATWPDPKALGLPATHGGSCRTAYLAAWAESKKEKV